MSEKTVHPIPAPEPQTLEQPPGPVPTYGFNPGYTATGVYLNTPPKFGSRAVELNCPQCNAHIVTEPVPKNGLLVWIIFGVLIFIGFFFIVPFFLAWIPFCVRLCKDIHHYCPNCRSKIGRYKRIGN